MMHYGFCRKHADQTGEGGCPECAMDHQQEEITALRAEVDRLQTKLTVDSLQVVIDLQAERDTLRAEVERQNEELESLRMKNGKGEIAAYYLLAEELAVPCGGSVVETVHETIRALRAEVEALTASLDANWVTHQRVVKAEARIAELEAEVARMKAEREVVLEAAWSRILKCCYAQSTRSSFDHIREYVREALLGEGKCEKS